MTESTNEVFIHQTIYEDKSKLIDGVVLPLGERLLKYHKNGQFHLLHNPHVFKRSTIIGMFVLRPAEQAWNDSIVVRCPTTDEVIVNEALYDIEDWVYNCDGYDGGGIIANGSYIDAFRLALQYCVSDAVIIGSQSASIEGVSREDDNFLGFIWQGYNPASWPHIREVEPNLFEMLQETRNLWQETGYLSDRKYPAQIICTESGIHYENSKDFLLARIFHENHPDGTPMEVYIITSIVGAQNIRQRCQTAHNLKLNPKHVIKLQSLIDRLDDILVIISSQDAPNKIEYEKIPEYLYKELKMFVVNHDGGRDVLRNFCKFGAVSQLNFTLCRGISLKQSPKLVGVSSEELRQRIKLMFSSKDSIHHGKIPRYLKPAIILTDTAESVAVVTFDTRQSVDFYQTEN